MIFTVEGYRRIKVEMLVEADSEAEAVQKAKEGRYLQVDTEPDCDLFRPAWRARNPKPTKGSSR